MEERENTIPNTQEENNLRNQEISKEDIIDSFVLKKFFKTIYKTNFSKNLY